MLVGAVYTLATNWYRVRETIARNAELQDFAIKLSGMVYSLGTTSVASLVNTFVGIINGGQPARYVDKDSGLYVEMLPK